MKKIIALMFTILIVAATASCASASPERVSCAAPETISAGTVTAVDLSCITDDGCEIRCPSVVELTADNWREYFEICTEDDWLPGENGEARELRINAYLRLKPEYAAMLVSGSPVSVSVEYDMTVRRGEVFYAEHLYAGLCDYAGPEARLHYDHDIEFEPAFLAGKGGLLTRTLTGISSADGEPQIRSFGSITVTAVSGSLTFRSAEARSC